MKKRARIIITTSCIGQPSDDVMERVLLNALFSEIGASESEFADSDIYEEVDMTELRRNTEKSIAESGRTVVSVIGEISEENGETVIRYRESDITHMAGAETRICFSESDEVTMVRTGSVSTALSFNGALERRFCWYNEAFFPVDISVITEQFKNTVTVSRGGTLDVIYCIEMNGIHMETSRLTVQVKPL